MKHIKTLTTRDLKESMKKGGCGECQTSCQSACKTSCTVGNQSCEKTKQSEWRKIPDGQKYSKWRKVFHWKSSGPGQAADPFAA